MIFADVSPSLFFGFVLTCLLIELTPGPNMIYLAILSATEGRNAGFAATAGIALGLIIVGIGAALGLAAVISNSAFLYQGLRIAGVVYLLWLAYLGWVAGGEISAGRAEHEAVTRYFTRGLVTNLLNPKAGVFYVMVLPSFIDVSRPATAQLLSLSFIFVLIATLIHCAIVVLAGTAQNFLEDRHRNKVVRRMLAVLLALVAVWFGWSTRS